MFSDGILYMSPDSPPVSKKSIGELAFQLFRRIRATMLLKSMNKIVSLLNKKLQNSYQSQKSRAAARTGDLRFVSVVPYQLSYNRILHEEDLLVVRSNNYQCRLRTTETWKFSLSVHRPRLGWL